MPHFTAMTASAELQVLEREHDFSQTWGWPEAQTEVARATACVAVVEVMGHLHEPADRLAAFQAVVEAVAATTDPLAIWAPNVCKFVPPGHADGLEPSQTTTSWWQRSVPVTHPSPRYVPSGWL